MLLARSYGPEGLGEYAATAVFVAVLTAVATFGAPYALSQRVAALDETRDPGFADLVRAAATLAVVAATASGAIAAVAWMPFAGIAGLVRPADVAVVVSAAFGAVILHMVASFLIGHLRMSAATLLFVLQPVAVIAGVTLLGPQRASGSTLAAIGFIAAALAALAVALAERAFPGPSGGELALLVRRSFPAAAVPYASVITTWMDRFIVGAIAGPTALGWWATASYLTEGVLRLPRAVGAFGVPAYARMTRDPIGVRRVMDSQVRLLLTFVLVAASVLVAAAPGVITAVYGEEFVLATTALRLLAISLLPAAIALSLTGGAVGTERLSRSLLVIAFVAPLQLIAGVALTSLFSIAGTALAQAITWTVAVGVLALRSSDRPAVLGGRGLLRVAALVIATAALSLAAARFADPRLAAAAAGAVTLGACLVLLVGEPERRLLRQLLRSGA